MLCRDHAWPVPSGCRGGAGAAAWWGGEWCWWGHGPSVPRSDASGPPRCPRRVPGARRPRRRPPARIRARATSSGDAELDHHHALGLVDLVVHVDGARAAGGRDGPRSASCRAAARWPPRRRSGRRSAPACPAAPLAARTQVSTPKRTAPSCSGNAKTAQVPRSIAADAKPGQRPWQSRRSGTSTGRPAAYASGPGPSPRSNWSSSDARSGRTEPTQRGPMTLAVVINVTETWSRPSSSAAARHSRSSPMATSGTTFGSAVEDRPRLLAQPITLVVGDAVAGDAHPPRRGSKSSRCHGA